jgi:4-hydroxy-tetrahydrodipicolinate synthase
VGAESTVLAEAFARHAQECGAAALMATPPVATAALAGELFDYYSRIARAVEIPLIVQDASGYVGRPLDIDLQARLLERFGPERILFKPEAPPLAENLSALHAATGGRARVFEGSGGVALVDCHALGIVGTMPGAEMVGAIVALWRALESGDVARAQALSAPIGRLVALQTTLDAFLAVEKHLLVRQGVFKNAIVRPPVGYLLNDAARAEVDRLFDELMEIVG